MFILENRSLDQNINYTDIEDVCDSYFINYVILFTLITILIINKLTSLILALRMYIYHKNLYNDRKMKQKRKLYYLKRKKEIYEKILKAQGTED